MPRRILNFSNYMEEHTIKNMGQDPIATKLRSVSHWILVVAFGLMPLLFIPTFFVPLGHTKTAVVIIAVLFSLIFFSLSVLRSAKLSYSFPWALVALWGVVIVTTVSALLSGDIADALLGDMIDIHTAGFALLLAVAATVWTFFNVQKESVMRLYMLIIVSTVILILFHVSRLVFGPTFLSFGIFGSATSTPFGGWNDLALLLGLAVILSLVTLEQLPLTKWGRVLFGVVVTASLIMLAVINFWFVWLVLGLVSAVMVIYVLSRDRFVTQTEEMFAQSSEETRTKSVASFVFPVIVFIVSAVFVMGGGALSAAIGNMTGISYVEVRPSFQATADIAQEVYKTDAFLGIGPNKFDDAWRAHKDDSINTTVFWNTDFRSGSGYLPTFFVTTGVLGTLAWIAFLALFVFGGVRMILRASDRDRVWYFIGTSAFTGAAFIWGMSLVYVPGAAILIIGALCTGLVFVAQGYLEPQRIRTATLAVNRRSGFLLTLGVVLVISGAVGGMFMVGKQYMSVYLFADSVREAQNGGEITEVERTLVQAFDLYGNDVYVHQIAEYEFARMNALISLENPTDEQRAQFQTASLNGVGAAQRAIERDATNPRNWAASGRIYGLLALVQVDEAYAFAKERLERARELDPKNPRRSLDLAQLEAQQGNYEAARALIEETLRKKPNYSDALFLSTQIDIALGDVASAVESTRAMISLAPQDATRYYQLGVLEGSRQNSEVAAQAFEAAVQLNPSYANARYFLALTYAELGRPADARAQLEQVLELNPGHEVVLALIKQIDDTGTINLNVGQVQQDDQLVVGDAEGVDVTDDNVTTEEVPDSPLLTPVNTPPAEEDSSDADGEATEAETATN